MIVDGMSHDEVRREVFLDADNMWNWIKWQRNKVIRHFKKQTRFPCATSLEWISPRKNRWLIIFVAFRRNVHNGGCGVFSSCLQKYQKGFALHQLGLTFEKHEYLTTYLPHFFDRYAERMQIEKTGVDLIKHFVKRNNVADNDETKQLSGRNSQYENSFHMCFEEGIGMGEKLNDEHVVMKTFITYDMTNDLQDEVFSELKILSENYEKIHKQMWYNKKIL